VTVKRLFPTVANESTLAKRASNKMDWRPNIGTPDARLFGVLVVGCCPRAQVVLKYGGKWLVSPLNYLLIRGKLR
jgi:hypothetical protein